MVVISLFRLLVIAKCLALRLRLRFPTLKKADKIIYLVIYYGLIRGVETEDNKLKVEF